MFFTLNGLADSVGSLEPWHKALTERGLGFQYVDFQATENNTFGDRIRALTKAISDFQKTNDSKGLKEPIFVVGQSAAGLAAVIAGTYLDNDISGVIAVSPAMPKGINPVGWSLLKIIWKYEFKILLGRPFSISEKDYKELVGGYNLTNAEDTGLIDRLVRPRQNISGVEARELSIPWLQPVLGKVLCPVVLICGEDDAWVRPGAQYSLRNKIAESGKAVEMIVVEKAGHLPAHGLGGEIVVNEALNKLMRLVDKNSLN